MCELSPTVQSLLSGVIGSVVGAGATIWATRETIKANAGDYEKRREHEAQLDYQQRLEALKGEVGFNLSLKEQGAQNKKIPVFVTSAWDNFISHSSRLKPEVIKLAAETYGWAVFHNSAAKLERVGVENFGGFIERGFDRAIEGFEKLAAELGKPQ